MHSHDDRTIGELIATLESDYRKCYQQVIMRLNTGERTADGDLAADYEFEARQLIRAAFAYIEGATYALKIEASFLSEEIGNALEPQYHQFIYETTFEVNEKGEVVPKPAKVPLLRNIRFAFATYAKAVGSDFQLDVAGKWWSQLQSSVGVRDRITHPGMPGDLDVSPAETITMVEAKAGFDRQLGTVLLPAKA